MADSISGLSLESLSGAYSKYSNTTVDTSAGDSVTSYMDFDSYLKVLAAQMSNQDFNDPMSDSEMLQQMASYSMLEGIQNMTQQANISYAANLVGKAITVNDNGTYDTGLVDSVVVESGTPYLMINGYMYNVNTVTNIADADIYNKLALLLNREVEAGAASGVVKSGTVTNVLIISGEGYVVVDGESMYPLSDITLKASETSSGEQTDDSENSDGEGVSLSSDTDENSETDSVTAYNNVQDSVEAVGYQAYSQALFDELISTIDAISGNETDTEAETPIIPDVSGYETVTISYVDAPDYAAAVFADDDELLQVLSASSVTSSGTSNDVVSTNYISGTASSSSSSSSDTLKSGLYDIPLTANNLNSVASSATNGRVSSILTNDEVLSVLSDDSYNTRYSTKYGLEVQSDTKPGISTSDCKPHRLNAEAYPQEAALADALGTRMYDIKFITNTAITSRIDTSTVIGKTISGEEITEIGYSGVGKLGEVVTFKNGTQRVEVILNNGNSCWFYTSGNYTLDEICDFNCAPGSLAGKLTPFEIAIRNYSREATSSDYASMAGLKSMLTSMGVNTVSA